MWLRWHGQRRGGCGLGVAFPRCILLGSVLLPDKLSAFLFAVVVRCPDVLPAQVQFLPRPLISQFLKAARKS